MPLVVVGARSSLSPARAATCRWRASTSIPRCSSSAGAAAPPGSPRRHQPRDRSSRGGEPPHRPRLFWHFPCYVGRATPASAVREGDFKLVEFFEDGGRVEFYDLARRSARVPRPPGGHARHRGRPREDASRMAAGYGGGDPSRSESRLRPAGGSTTGRTGRRDAARRRTARRTTERRLSGNHPRATPRRTWLAIPTAAAERRPSRRSAAGSQAIWVWHRPASRRTLPSGGGLRK